MAQRTCTIDDCQRKHLARGMCSSHYGTWHRQKHGRKRNDTPFEITCITCGEPYLSSRPEGRYCSELCYHFDKWGPRTCRWPKPERKKAAPKPVPTVRLVECGWCGEQFATTRKAHLMCSAACKRRAARNRRRGRASGSTSHFTWAEVMRLFLTFGRCCAYCEQPIVGQPDPDHVVPLSRGGSNSITNILPACRLCNSDKRDLLLTEWAEDRERRGLPAVTTTWTADDPHVRHLTSLVA